MLNIAIILAGGSGTRLGSEIPKQFIEVCGRPIILHTINCFEKHPAIDSIVVVCKSDYYNNLESLLVENSLSKVEKIVPGGKTFLESVINGVEGLSSIAHADDNILIHYGASPFVDSDIIDDAIRVCNNNGNACPAMPLIPLSGGSDLPDSTNRKLLRDNVICFNSPQAIKYLALIELLKRGKEAKILESIDPHTTSLMLELGERIYFSMDKSTNIKITTKDDIRLFEAWYEYLAKENQKHD